MSILLGLTFAAGVVLVVSRWAWPTAANRRTRTLKRKRLTELCGEAGLNRLTGRGLIAISLWSACLIAALMWLISAVSVLAFLTGCFAGTVPFLLVRSRRRKRQKARRLLWPDVCDLLIAAARPGLSLPQVVSSLADSAPELVRPAFVAFRRDFSASGHFDASIDRLRDSLADPVADRIFETVRMARHLGGTELVPVLHSLAQSVRSDVAVRGEVEARQSWIRGAAILGAIAPWVIVVLLAFRPEGVRAYTSGTGMVLLLIGAGVSVLAFWLMSRIGHLPDEKRWLL